MRTRWKGILTENLGYKAVALVIAFVLWVSILGRRDFVITRVMDVDIEVPQEYVVVSQTPETVKVKVSGPRTALKKFVEGGLHRTLVLSGENLKLGNNDVPIELGEIEVPFGIKVVGVRPQLIQVHIKNK